MPTNVKTKTKRNPAPLHSENSAAPAKSAPEEKEQLPKQSFFRRLIFGEEKHENDAPASRERQAFTAY